MSKTTTKPRGSRPTPAAPAPVTITAAPVAVALALDEETADRAREIIEKGTPENTRRARRAALRYFWQWAGVALGLEESYPVPAGVVIRFCTDHLAGLAADVDRELVSRAVKAKLGPHSVATVEARCAHLSAAHVAQGLDSPARDPRVAEILKAARRQRARAGGQHQKAAMTVDVLNAILATCDDSTAGIRDRALLLLAFSAGGRRRSEVAAARVEDLEEIDREYVLRIRRSKTDQEGAGLAVPVAGRAADALRAWLEVAGLEAGRIFRRVSRTGNVFGDGISPYTVARVIQRRAELAGLNGADFGGHSARAGFITEGAQRGIPLPELMALSGHKTVDVANRYYRAGAALHSPAARMAG